MFGKKKEDCPICGQPAKGLLNKVIADGKVCKECSDKIQMDLNMLEFQTADDIKKHFEYREENRQRFKEFKPTRKHNILNGEMLIDDKRKEWYLQTDKKDDNPPVYRFDEIIDFELMEDGDTVTKGGAGSALVGGVLFGNVGAVVGGTVGKKKSKTEVTTMCINITLSNEYVTIVKIPLIGMFGKVKSGTSQYSAIKANANAIVATLNKMCNEQ